VAFASQTANRSAHNNRLKSEKPIARGIVIRRAKVVARMVPKALRLVWAAGPGLATAQVVLTIIQGVLPAVAIWFTKAIVDGVVTAARTGARADSAQVLLLVALWFGAQLLTAITGAILQLASSLHMQMANQLSGLLRSSVTLVSVIGVLGALSWPAGPLRATLKSGKSALLSIGTGGSE
jgi:hypothetical protein